MTASIQDLLDGLAQKPEAQCYVQRLQPAVTNITRGKKGPTKVTFVTEQTSPGEFIARTGKVGFVVWVARERLE